MQATPGDNTINQLLVELGICAEGSDRRAGGAGEHAELSESMLAVEPGMPSRQQQPAAAAVRMASPQPQQLAANAAASVAFAVLQSQELAVRAAPVPVANPQLLSAANPLPTRVPVAVVPTGPLYPVRN